MITNRNIIKKKKKLENAESLLEKDMFYYCD